MAGSAAIASAANMDLPRFGGHAPGHLRGAFEGWLMDELEQPEIDGDPVDADWLIGQLWNCTDIMPSILCSWLGLPPGSTYAVGARLAKETED